MKTTRALRQITSLSTQSASLTRLEGAIVRLLAEGPRSIENVMASMDFDNTDTRQVVRHLIENQYARLVVTAHLWGVEFAVELTKQGREHLAGS